MGRFYGITEQLACCGSNPISLCLSLQIVRLFTNIFTPEGEGANEVEVEVGDDDDGKESSASPRSLLTDALEPLSV